MWDSSTPQSVSLGWYIFYIYITFKVIIDRQASEAALQRELRSVFRPEFLNRLDEIIPFHPLGEAEMTVITGKLLAQLGDRLKEKGVTLRVSPEACAWLAKSGHGSDAPALHRKGSL